MGNTLDVRSLLSNEIDESRAKIGLPFLYGHCCRQITTVLRGTVARMTEGSMETSNLKGREKRKEEGRKGREVRERGGNAVVKLEERQKRGGG